MRIGFAEADPHYISRAIEVFKREPQNDSMRWAALNAMMRLAALQRDLDGHSSTRTELAQMLQSNLKSGSPIQLQTRLMLINAMRQEAEGLGGDAGRAMLKQAVSESEDLLSATRKIEQGESLRAFERFHRLIVGQLALVNRDLESLRTQSEAQRVATAVRQLPIAQIAEAQALDKLLYDLATLVRGEEGLQMISEIRRSQNVEENINATLLTSEKQLREQTSRGLETVQGHWQISPVDGDRTCLERVRIERQRAMMDVLEQSILADSGRSSMTALNEPIRTMLRIQTEISRQPESMQPNSIELILGIAYRLQATGSRVPEQRAELIEQAARQLKASERRLQNCFCRWQEEELSREHTALEQLQNLN